MAYDEQLALDTESKRETARLELVKRNAELEAFADRIHALALRGQAELEEHELPEVNGSLVEIAEAAARAMSKK